MLNRSADGGIILNEPCSYLALESIATALLLLLIPLAHSISACTYLPIKSSKFNEFWAYNKYGYGTESNFNVLKEKV